MKLEVLNKNGESLGREVELPASVFGLEIGDKLEHVVYLAVKQYNANQRQGTHKTKERAEIKGSTRKFKRQKGTGTARVGSVKSPVLIGGGRVFGPRPRTYSVQLNKKVKQLARKAVLSAKARDGEILLVEDFTFDSPRTKEYINFLSALKVNTQKTVLLIDVPAAPKAPTVLQRPHKPRGSRKAEQYATAMKTYNESLGKFQEAAAAYEVQLDSYEQELDNIYTYVALSARNLPKAEVVNAKDFNVYQILNANKVILTEGALERIAAQLG